METTQREKINGHSDERIDLNETERMLKEKISFIDHVIERYEKMKPEILGQLEAIDRLRHFRDRITNLNLEIESHRQQYGEATRRVHVAVDNMESSFTIKDVEDFLESNKIPVKKSTIQVTLGRLANSNVISIIERKSQGQKLNVYKRGPKFNENIIRPKEEPVALAV